MENEMVAWSSEGPVGRDWNGEYVGLRLGPLRHKSTGAGLFHSLRP